MHTRDDCIPERCEVPVDSAIVKMVKHRLRCHGRARVKSISNVEIIREKVRPRQKHGRKGTKSSSERRRILPTELTTAERVLYRIIANAVVAEEMTPTTIALRSALALCGHSMSRDRLGEAVRRLDEVGLIQRKRIGSLRVYLLPGSDRHTKPCKEPQIRRRSERRATIGEQAKAIEVPDWPRPTAASIAAYDAAMARQPYAAAPRKSPSNNDVGQLDRAVPITILGTIARNK